MSEARGQREDLDWEEVQRVANHMIFAARPLHAAIHDIIRDHDLGPRGPWIVLLVHNGQTTPGELADMFGIGRSLVTAELNRLFEAGLVGREPKSDRRLTGLVLTEDGEQAYRRVKQGLSTLINTRLRHYSRDEILLCAHMLEDMNLAEPDMAPAQLHRIARSSGQR